jgi:hypothetical protein
MFRAIDAPIVPVKGVALAQWLYDDAAERPLRDVDLLIPRAHFAPLKALVLEKRYPIEYLAEELGELAFEVDGFPIDVHAEFGLRDFTTLSVDDVVRRAAPDRLFGVEVLRIDEMDHLLLLAVNVTKDGFVRANPHQPEDLVRLLRKLESGRGVALLIERAREASFITGLRNVALWMAEEHGAAEFGNLVPLLRPRRILYSALVHGWWKGRARGYGGLLLGSYSNDRLPVRARSLGRWLRRGALRALGLPRG